MKGIILGLVAVMAVPAVALADHRDRGTRFSVSVGYSNQGGYGGGYRGYDTSVSYGRGGYGGGYRGDFCGPVYRPAPVFYAPPPVYYAPPPVVYAPPPVVYAPPPVVYTPPVVYQPAPVYVPAPVVYQPPVYVAPAPVYYPSERVDFRFSYRR